MPFERASEEWLAGHPKMRNDEFNIVTLSTGRRPAGCLLAFWSPKLSQRLKLQITPPTMRVYYNKLGHRWINFQDSTGTYFELKSIRQRSRLPQQGNQDNRRITMK